jgi:hypothetical protein
MALNEYTGQTAPLNAQDEAGATDNVLNLNPNDPQWQSVVDAWEDGGEYVFAKVRVRQESPGRFIVLSAEPEGAEAEAEPGETGAMGEASDVGERASEGYANPAVSRLMAE